MANNSYRKSRRIRRSLERAWLASPFPETRDSIADSLVDAWSGHARAKSALFEQRKNIYTN